MSDGSNILTDAELHELTGALFPSKQASILEQHGIAYVRRLDGKIRTTWYNVNHPRLPGAVAPDAEPDFSGFDDGKKAQSGR